MWSVKQGGLHKGGNECCMKNRWRRSARKTRKRFRRGLQKWNVRRQRNVKLIGKGKRERARRAKEVGPEAIRKGKYPRCTQ